LSGYTNDERIRRRRGYEIRMKQLSPRNSLTLENQTQEEAVKQEDDGENGGGRI
jgi:hypothetical protein